MAIQAVKDERYRLITAGSSMGGRIAFTQKQLDNGQTAGTGLSICKAQWGGSATRIIRPSYDIRCTGNSPSANPNALVAGFRPQLLVRYGAGGQSRIRTYEGIRPFAIECSELDIAFTGQVQSNLLRDMSTPYSATDIRGKVAVQVGDGEFDDTSGNNLRSMTFYAYDAGGGGSIGYIRWCVDGTGWVSGGAQGWGILNAAGADNIEDPRPVSLMSIAGYYGGSTDCWLQFFDRSPLLDQYGIPDNTSGFNSGTIATFCMLLKAGENFSADFGPEGMPFYVSCIYALSTTPVVWTPIVAVSTPDITMRAVWWENVEARFDQGVP